ncbi:MAG: ATP-binding protein [Candidatus Nanopelagicus sp.]
MSTIVIKSGEYRNQAVVNQVFTLVKGFQTGKKANYITVKNEGQFSIAIDVVKIKVNNISDIEYLGENEKMTKDVIAFKAKEQKEVAVVESDEDAMNRIATRFSVLDEMSSACIAGDIRAMIVSGPPGVGKSHGVTMQMEKASMFDKISGKRPRFEIVKGAISGIGLFATLYKYSDKKNVLVFDDCDVWEDQDALNVLKGALDSGKTRRISWNKDSRLLRDEGVPNTFNFNGSVIFITNLNFSDRKSNKIKAHLEALQSRCHYLDLTIDTERDKMLRIKQVHRDADGGLFSDYEFGAEQGEEILEFMWANQDKLREISLRMALKIADLVKISKNWKNLATNTCMKR